MNSNTFISLKMGKKTLFTHPLSQLKQIPILIKNKNLSKKNNPKKFLNMDVIPRYILNQHMNELNQELTKKLINKKNIFDKIKNTYFSKSHPDFHESLGDIENEMNTLQESIDKGNNNDYKKFTEMISIINSNKTNEKIKTIQKMNITDYKNINKEIENDIINSISLNKKIFSQRIGLNKKNLKLSQPINRNNQLNSNLDLNKNYNTTDNKSYNITDNKSYNITENNINLLKKSTNTNNNNINYNTEPNDIKNNNNYNTGIYENNQNKVIPITNEQIELFKTFVGNSKLSNNMITSYFDMYNPKVKFAAERYFKSRYGSEFITLNFVYPIRPGNKQHKFRLISEIKELFMAVENDTISMSNPKLILENGKELLNNRKFKCIGALNLNNNSIIKVFKK